MIFVVYYHTTSALEITKNKFFIIVFLKDGHYCGYRNFETALYYYVEALDKYNISKYCFF